MVVLPPNFEGELEKNKRRMNHKNSKGKERPVSVVDGRAILAVKPARSSVCIKPSMI